MNKKITNSDFSKNIEFKIDKEELRILKLQKEYKSGNINEENISDDDYFKLMFNFLYFTGWRISEFTGFQWKNFDPINHTAKVRVILSCKIKNKKWDLIDQKIKSKKKKIRENLDDLKDS